MSDNKPVDQKTEPLPPSPVQEQSNPTSVTLNHNQLVSICAAGLFVSFFLPWAQMLGGSVSGFDLQKMDGLKLLLVIPVFATGTLIVSVSNRNPNVIASLAGIGPFLALAYWWKQLGSDVMHLLTYGAYMSLGFGLTLCILGQGFKLRKIHGDHTP